MRTFFRVVLALVSALSTLYFVVWVCGAVLMLLRLSPWASSPISLVAALAVGRYVWLHTTSIGAGLLRSMMLGAILVGSVGFAGGFFGPIVFMPDANQGPLLGIFITGPLGCALGAVCGAIHWLAHGRHRVSERREPSTAD